MYRAARISRDLELTHCAVMYASNLLVPLLDRIARLERQMAERDSQLGEARAANSALAAENRSGAAPEGGPGRRWSRRQTPS